MNGEGSDEPDEPATFHADHPFIFMIRDRLTGTILFQGRMSDPSQAPLQD
jgi:serpin B